MGRIALQLKVLLHSLHLISFGQASFCTFYSHAYHPFVKLHTDSKEFPFCAVFVHLSALCFTCFSLHQTHFLSSVVFNHMHCYGPLSLSSSLPPCIFPLPHILCVCNWPDRVPSCEQKQSSWKKDGSLSALLTLLENWSLLAVDTHLCKMSIGSQDIVNVSK